MIKKNKDEGYFKTYSQFIVTPPKESFIMDSLFTKKDLEEEEIEEHRYCNCPYCEGH